MRLLLIALFVAGEALSSIPRGKEAGGFICVPDYSTGFARSRDGKWEPARFNVEGKRYLFRVQDGRWFWTDFGEEPEESIDACTAIDAKGFSECKNREDEVVFNRNTLRFQVVYPYGYVVSDADKNMGGLNLTPHIEIGRCSVL